MESERPWLGLGRLAGFGREGGVKVLAAVSSGQFDLQRIERAETLELTPTNTEGADDGDIIAA
jgi:hypothetical protein